MPEPAVRVFVIWEPVLDTDVRPPRPEDRARVPGQRASHYWDSGLLVSKALKEEHTARPLEIAGKQSLVEEDIAWDLVAMFPPGVQWDDSFPRPAFLGGPVIQVQDQAIDHTRQMTR